MRPIGSAAVTTSAEGLVKSGNRRARGESFPNAFRNQRVEESEGMNGDDFLWTAGTSL
jgi:hypothetical protein